MSRAAQLLHLAAEEARDTERAEAAALRDGVQAERERAGMERREREGAEREVSAWVEVGRLRRAWRELLRARGRP